MHTLIAFASQWGSKLGGINCFNTDLLSAFGDAYHQSAKTVCIVATATEEDIQDALNHQVHLLPLPCPPAGNKFTKEQAPAAIAELEKNQISFNPTETVWLGHDLISGAAANEAAKKTDGCSALIHHMSYDHYESFAEDSATANEKSQNQAGLFQKADRVLAVGPLLRDAMQDRLGGSKEVTMLIPGLAEIDTRPAPNTFTAFLSGRLSDDASKIKQGHLGVAAFAKAQYKARKAGMPDALQKQPKLILRGVDFESKQPLQPKAAIESPEIALKKFAEQYADAVINLHALPYTLDRQTLYNDLSGSSVALMPSWHEGFGLVAWEAIAAGVPLIVSEHSGVYQLLTEQFSGNGTGCVFPVVISGKVDKPFFHQDDLKAVVKALTDIAKDSGKARQQAGQLRNLLGKYTWSACAEQAAKAFQWPLQKGSIPTEITERKTTTHCQPASPGMAATSHVIPPLCLPAKQWQANCGMADSQLLRAEEAQVPFDSARQPDLEKLYHWLDDSKWPLSVRLLTGAGGLGKTRLALELCQQRLAQDWQSGFWDNDCQTDTIVSAWQGLKDSDQPLLIVIDYAETRQTILLALIKAIQQNPCDRPVRVLLLARNGGEWWDNLTGEDAFCEALLSGYATSGPFRLPPLYLAKQDRGQAYQRALHAFAQTLDVTAPDGVPEMSGEHFGRPLYVQMAALLALHGERPTTAEGLTRALLNHERRYWQGLLKDTSVTAPARHAQLLLALATLAGGFKTPSNAEPYWSAANWGTGAVNELDVLFHALTPLYPGSQGLQAVRPDLLGEALVSQSLLGMEADGLLDAVLSAQCQPPVRRHALTVLARLSGQHTDLYETLSEVLSRHFVHCYSDILTVAVETGGGLPLLAKAAFKRLPLAGQSQLAGLLEPNLREESVQLAGLACAISGFLAEKTAKKFYRRKNNLKHKAEYANALLNYSLTLRRVGQNEQALMPAQQGQKLSQQLYIKHQKRFAGQHARFLNNVSSHLSDIGKYEEALANARESLEIYKRLAEQNPDRYESDYAMTLNNVGSNLSDIGKYEEALANAMESLAIRKRLAEQNPDRYESVYARSLNNVGSHLSDAGKYEEALANAKESLEIYKRLAEQNPDRYESDYAMSLSNVGSHLSDAGKYEEALANAMESLAIRKRLAEQNPDRYESDYAMSLSNVGSHLSDAGKYEEALANAMESLAIRKRLAEQNPDRYESDYATSLNNVGSHLSDAGKYEEALANAKESLAIRKRLAEQNPDRYESDYAMSLSNVGSHLSDAGKYEEALANAEESLAIRKRLAEQNPDRYETASFTSSCYTLFLAWLAGSTDQMKTQKNLPPLPEKVLPHRIPVLQLYRNFVEACCFSDETRRTALFQQRLADWENLLPAEQNDNKEYWLCVTAWCDTFFPQEVDQIDWQADWIQFKKQRQGSIPNWMEKTAQKLAFQFPQ